MRPCTARHDVALGGICNTLKGVWGVWGGEFINYNLLIENGE
jgi:hypothetical protein